MQLIFHSAIYLPFLFYLFLFSLSFPFFRCNSSFYSVIPRWSMCIVLFLYGFFFPSSFYWKAAHFLYAMHLMDENSRNMHGMDDIKKEESTQPQVKKAHIKTEFITYKKKTFHSMNVMRHPSWFIVSFDTRYSFHASIPFMHHKIEFHRRQIKHIMTTLFFLIFFMFRYTRYSRFDDRCRLTSW